MKTLSELTLKKTYRSSTDNLLTDFYYPTLSRSERYDRSVGYFTSRSLAQAGRGLGKLYECGGKLRIIASPKLEQEDIEAIRTGYEDPDSEIIELARRSLEPVEDTLTQNRLSALAWLIADGRLGHQAGNQGR